MKAWVVRELGSPEKMQLEDLPLGPAPPDKVRVAVEAAGLNFFDSLLIAGTYQVKPDLPFIPGAEVAGTVLVAPQGSGLFEGDRVMARLSANGIDGGGYAEIAHADPAHTVKIPPSMPFEHAAAMFITYQTGWFALHRRAQLKSGDFLLVHAGSGGVGSAAIQLGKAAGAVVIATAGSPEKVRLCVQLGADLAINYKADDFVQAVKDFTEGHGADVIYDPVGGEVTERSTRCIAFEGRLVVIGFTSGQVPQLRANHALIKNYAVVGLHWGLYDERRPDLVDQCTQELLTLYLQGRIRPFVFRRVPLEEAGAALVDVAQGRSSGKTVVVAHPESPQLLH